MTNYNHLREELVEQLRKIVGNKYVIYNDPERLEPYSHDEVAEKEYFAMPEAVVKPKTQEEIVQIVRLANKYLIPITPRGAGSGLSGGAIPVYGGIVLSFERMNRIIDIDLGNMMVEVEPGVVTNHINEVLKKHGLMFAGYPMSLETCFIGGNVAENAGGGKAIKYGVTSRYIMGIEAVIGTGDVIKLGGKVRKDVTGYDLIHLLTGSEGTLVIFTKITLSLLPIPGATTVLLALFKSTEEAISVVPKLLSVGKIIPTSIEYMDRLSVITSCEYLNEELPYREAEAMLLLELDGKTMEEVEHDYEIVGDICMKEGAFEVYVADNRTTTERIWNIRRNIAEAFKVKSPFQSLEDIVIPTASIPQFMKLLQKLSAKHNVAIPCYGHAGDGNLHATVVKPENWPMDKWREKLDIILQELYEITARFNGKISGEHGIGNKRKKYIGINLSPEIISLMRGIKKVFDPNNILNPGKIFPE